MRGAPDVSLSLLYGSRISVTFAILGAYDETDNSPCSISQIYLASADGGNIWSSCGSHNGIKATRPDVVNNYLTTLTPNSESFEPTSSCEMPIVSW